MKTEQFKADRERIIRMQTRQHSGGIEPDEIDWEAVKTEWIEFYDRVLNEIIREPERAKELAVVATGYKDWTLRRWCPVRRGYYMPDEPLTE